MVEIDVRYEGELRCRLLHGPSGSELLTDAPVDNQGRGEGFSPTDLVAAALGSCILTVMAIGARRHGLELAGSTAKVRKAMVADPARRIARLEVELRIAGRHGPEERALLERLAATCPVKESLSPRTELRLSFVWESGDAAS